MRPLVEEMLPFFKKGCLITDVGSVKRQVVKELVPLANRAGAHFVGSHPMAGSEHSGVAAAKADLFAGAVCVVTPTPKSDRAAVRQVEQLWVKVGARVRHLSPRAHDQMVSRTSHLPYFTAAAMSRLVLSRSSPAEQRMLCAGGFRDATRIASGSPEMWRDIAMANKTQIAAAMSALIRDLEQLRTFILDGESRQLESRLREAKAERDRWRAEVLKARP
jgi:prephenate dehydrogenase